MGYIFLTLSLEDIYGPLLLDGLWFLRIFLIVLETFLMILTFFSTFTDGTSLLASFVCYDSHMILFCVHNSYQIKTGNLVKGVTIFGIKQLLKYCSIQHPFVLTLMRKHCFPVGTINCVEFARSPQVCVLPKSVWVFSGILVSSHTPKMCIWGKLMCLHCPSLSEYQCEWPCDRTASCPGLFHVFLPELPG